MKLSVNLKNCYGISNLNTEFDFSSKRTYAIYAPNGVMKTSFAKTFKDLSNDEPSKDLVFPKRKTVRDIKDENNDDIKPENIFVVEPYNEQFNSNKLSTLLVSKSLKDKYDKLYSDLEIEKKGFITKLKGISQSTDCEYELLSSFAISPNDDFFSILCNISKQLDGKRAKYDFRYNDVFDKKGNVKKFLDKNQKFLDLYVKNYETLISNSKFFKKSENTFGTYQANTILKSVSDNAFFDAGHLLELNDNTKINSAKTLKNILDSEVDKVMNDVELKKIFEKIDFAISSNAELRAFKPVIENNNLLLVELKDYELFKKKVWIGYLDQLQSDVVCLVKLYNSKKKQLENIILQAKSEKTEWEKSIDEFNGRFKELPFKLSIKNKDDVILKTSTPTVEFVFSDANDKRVIDRSELLNVLSQGERRALYLLNIIFEVQARKKAKQETVFIIDDIADSFDYKNKYAIIEYLIDISKNEDFYQLILTHNFDFFRTIESRFVCRSFCKVAIKTESEIKIENAGYFKPFKYFKDNLDKNVILIASIPFIRNLAEYSGYKNEFTKLTSLLHMKPDSYNLNVGDLENIIKTILVDKNNLSLQNKTKNLIKLIFETADILSKNNDELLELENKVVLSIAIRLKAEEFMIGKINDSTFLGSIQKNQTTKLINKYKEKFPRDTVKNDLLEQVNLMTPENIHLNSFMYEPILDLSNKHLIDLYLKVKQLN